MDVTSLLIFIVAFFVALLAIPSIIKVAKEKSLFDKPTDERKIHTESIPNLGGVAIFLGFYFSILMFRVLCDSIELSALCAASVLLFFVALKDDLISTAPLVRLVYQFVIALIIVLVGHIYFSNIPFFEASHVALKGINIAFSLIFIVTIINAFNFIDGIDGLAGSLAVLGLCAFGFLFFQYGEFSYAHLSFALAGSTLAFLLYNFHPAKIFMGDIGSMLLGVFISVLAIKLANLEPLRIGLVPVKHPSSMAFAILLVPIMDIVTVILIRLHLKLSPFQADKRHTHHRLLALGLGHTGVTLTLVCFNIVAILAALLFGRWMPSSVCYCWSCWLLYSS
jgi:UDP-N-acetylmuramyl pentapeptide phosphotransferase/UDP-N-acetylglucosamine-1-phosphate transferase